MCFLAIFQKIWKLWNIHLRWIPGSVNAFIDWIKNHKTIFINRTGYLGYAEVDVQDFVNWEIDFIKVDGCYMDIDEYEDAYEYFGQPKNYFENSKRTNLQKLDDTSLKLKFYLIRVINSFFLKNPFETYKIWTFIKIPKVV